MKKKRPRVLIVDDRPDEEATSIASALSSGALRVDLSHPEDVIETQLSSVDLLLVDFDLQKWDQSELPVANTCSTGWSLAAVLRDRARSVDDRKTAIATAILTSRMDAATMPFTSAGREHIAAELNGIEWVFEKTDERLVERLTVLASATLVVQRDWNLSDLLDALKVGKADFSRQQDVLRCRPPLSESLLWEDGLGVVRWMLHKILPYPTFLIDEAQLGARLGLSRVDTMRLVAGKTKLAMGLKQHRYAGLLADFVGPRWWRVGVDSFLWSLSGGRPTDTALLRDLAKKALKSVSEPLPDASFNLVVCYDENLCPLPRPVDASLAVRIWPDDWPPYASQPWATIEAVDESLSLKRIAAPLEPH